MTQGCCFKNVVFVECLFCFLFKSLGLPRISLVTKHLVGDLAVALQCFFHLKLLEVRISRLGSLED